VGRDGVEGERIVAIIFQTLPPPNYVFCAIEIRFSDNEKVLDVISTLESLAGTSIPSEGNSSAFAFLLTPNILC